MPLRCWSRSVPYSPSSKVSLRYCVRSRSLQPSSRTSTASLPSSLPGPDRRLLRGALLRRRFLGGGLLRGRLLGGGLLRGGLLGGSALHRNAWKGRLLHPGDRLGRRGG